MKRLLYLIGLAGFASACSGSSSMVAPSPATATTTAPVAAPVSAGDWTVTITTTANQGTSFCIFTPAVGSTFQGPYTLALGAGRVLFEPSDPIDWDSFDATLNGLSFNGSNPPQSSGAGMCTHYLQSSTLSGTFAADMRSFTASETWTFTLDSGATQTLMFSWSGVQR